MKAKTQICENKTMELTSLLPWQLFFFFIINPEDYKTSIILYSMSGPYIKVNFVILFQMKINAFLPRTFAKTMEYVNSLYPLQRIHVRVE